MTNRRTDRFQGQPALPATVVALCAAVALAVWPTQPDLSADATAMMTVPSVAADPSLPAAATVFAGRMAGPEEAAPTF